MPCSWGKPGPVSAQVHGGCQGLVLPPPPLQRGWEACLPRRPDGGIPGRSDNRRPSNLLAWNSLPLPGPPCGSREGAGRAEGAGAPRATQPSGPRSLSNWTRALLLLGTFRQTGRQRWASADYFEGPSPKSCSEGEGRAGEGPGLAQGHPGDAELDKPATPSAPALTVCLEAGTPQWVLEGASDKDPTENEGDPRIMSGGTPGRD